MSSWLLVTGAPDADDGWRKAMRGRLPRMASASSDAFHVLPAVASSVGRARRMVAATVLAYGHKELVENATLLVSEVVTNSVLHAGTELRVRCMPSRDGIRVEVFDRSPLLPTARNYGSQAATGRGLTLVSAVAMSWGIELSDGGKTLWFELGGRSAVGTQHMAPDPLTRRDTVLTVRLREASVPLTRATIEHSDALLRELALLAISGDLDHATRRRWRSPQFDVSPILAALDAAAAAGRTKADLELILAAGSHSAAVERQRMVEHADALAGQGELLCVSALPEVAACRRWLYRQIDRQAMGSPAEPWELPEPVQPVRTAVALSEKELQDLQRVSAAAVVADDANRIIFVNEAAGELLGWAPSALVGQRLTVLIPPELREAHLAGFSRLQVTGEAHILGSTVRVPALRRDGTSVATTLTIEQHEDSTGQRTFRAVIAPAPISDHSPPVAPVSSPGPGAPP